MNWRGWGCEKLNLRGRVLVLCLLFFLILGVLAGCGPPPCDIVITSLRPAKTNVRPGEKVDVVVTIQGCGSGVVYVWSADNGTVPSGQTNQAMISYVAPEVPGPDTVSVTVQDTQGHSASEEVVIEVLNVQSSLEILEPPTPEKTVLGIGEQTLVTVKATCAHPCSPDKLVYKWSADYGGVPDGFTDRSTITYTAPVAAGRDTVHVTVEDDQDNSVSSQSSVIRIITDQDAPPKKHDVTITDPKTGEHNCPGTRACQVQVRGRFDGPDDRKGVEVLLLVLPLEPGGGGWWIQGGLSVDREDGTWSIDATLGDDETPPQTGHVFSLRALLVDQSVAANPAFAPGQVFDDYSVIPYLEASDRVNLTIQSP